MNLNGDSDPTQIDATESLIQSGTQTLTPSGRNSSEGRTSSVFPLSSSLLVEPLSFSWDISEKLGKTTLFPQHGLFCFQNKNLVIKVRRG